MYEYPVRQRAPLSARAQETVMSSQHTRSAARKQKKPFRAKNLRRRRLPAALLSVLLLFLLCLLFTAPARYAEACIQGMALWAKAVLPALFPFLILTGLLTKLGAAQKLADRLSPLTEKIGLPGSAAYCLLVSLLSGYPVGSRTVADLYKGGAITREQAKRMSVLCSTSGPMFLVGSVGGAMFGSAAAGAVLLAAHLLAVIGVYLALYFANRRKKRNIHAGQKAPAPHAGLKKTMPPHTLRVQNKTAAPQTTASPALENKRNKTAAPHPDTDGILAASVQSGVLTVLCVGGFITFFFVLMQALSDLHISAPLERLLSFPLSAAGSEGAAAGLTAGLLEATQGCASIAASGAPLALPLCAFLVTFGGGSILAQQLAFLTGAGVKAGPFIGIKILQGIAAFLLCLAFCSFVL